MGKKRAAHAEPEPNLEEQEVSEEPEDSPHDGSDEDNDYGMGDDGSSGEGEEDGADEGEQQQQQQEDEEDGGEEDDGDANEEGEGEEEEEEEDEQQQQQQQAEGPGILGLASGSEDEGGDIDDGGAPSADEEEEEQDEGQEEGQEEEEEEQEEGQEEGQEGEEEAREPGSSDADDEGSSGGAGASGSGSDSEGGDGAPRQAAHHASFLAGEKGASFAKAFSKIISKPVKAAKPTVKDGSSKAAAVAAAELILAESAGVQKRKREEEEDAAARHEAKKHRMAMRTRGHVAIPRKGEDPAHDVREKQLQRLATRGVVLLFNAVNKAQRQKAEAEAAGGVAKRKAAVAKLSKASFLTELTQAATKGVPVAAAGGQEEAGRKLQGEQQQQAGANWDVLGEGFPGLTRGAKMKDWDKKAGSDEDEVGEQPRLAAAEISSDEEDGW